MSEVLVEVKHLKQYFSVKTGLFRNTPLKAVDDVSFIINKGETLGLVGESGCGKTTVGRSMLNLYTPTGGEVFFKGEKVDSNSIKHLCREMQMVFQDPYSSLNPRMTVADIIGEPLDIHHMCATKEERKKRITEIMELVGLNSEHARRYAHEFSGGQRQRIGIARAIALNPSFIVCDESVSALDVSIQAQIINMFKDLQAKLGLSYLFIAHDIHVVNYMSNRVAVMYLGKIIEMGDTEDISDRPTHPYTISLLSAIPVADPKESKKRRRIVLEGDVPSPLKVPSGCSFRTRCQFATKKCAEELPLLENRGNNHFVACWNK